MVIFVCFLGYKKVSLKSWKMHLCPKISDSNYILKWKPSKFDYKQKLNVLAIQWDHFRNYPMLIRVQRKDFPTVIPCQLFMALLGVLENSTRKVWRYSPNRQNSPNQLVFIFQYLFYLPRHILIILKKIQWLIWVHKNITNF